MPEISYLVIPRMVCNLIFPFYVLVVVLLLPTLARKGIVPARKLMALLSIYEIYTVDHRFVKSERR
jgi:hypothetical protein